MSNTYTNPLANKAVALIGTFKSFDTSYAIRVLKQMGAISHDKVVQELDIVVVGDKPGRKLRKATKLGIDQWDEATLTQVFADHNTHLQNQPSASSFDPLMPAFQHSGGSRYYPRQLYGLPPAYQIHQHVLGTQYAYVLDLDNDAGIWDYPGLGTLQALIIEGATDNTWATFAKQLHRLPTIKALVINNARFTKQAIDADQVLTALPQLECLFCINHRHTKHSAITFNVARHSNLQQLHIDANVVEGLSLTSLPKLRLLRVEPSTLSAAIEGLKNNAYPRLNTLQVFDEEDCISLLKQLPAAPHITRLMRFLAVSGWARE